MSETMLISQLSARSGFSPSALRYYEHVGLLTTAARSPGGYRLYDERAVFRLRFINRAKQLGLPLGEIRELAVVWDRGMCAQMQERLRAHIAAKSAEVEARIAELAAFAAQLDRALDDLAIPAIDGCCAEGCGCADSTAVGPPSPQFGDLLARVGTPSDVQQP